MLRARAVVVEIAAIGVDAGGIAGGDAMSSVDAEASVRSIVRSRAGWIRRRLCCRQ
jgi:hypothetical protein